MSDIGNFLTSDGKVKQFPAKRKMKLAVLAYLADKFDVDRIYTEKEVNELLCEWHTFDDPAALRRELYNLHFLDRTSDGMRYGLASVQPDIGELLERYG